MSNLILLAPFLAALVALLAKDRLHSVIILLCYLSLEGLFKLMSGYHPIVHIGVDIVLWTMIAAWSMMAILSRRTKIPRIPLLLIVLLHIAWVLLLVFSPYTPSTFAGLVSLKVHLSMIPLYVIGFLLGEEADAPRKVLRTLTIFWSGAFLLTILQYAGGPGSIFDLGDVYMNRLAHYHEWRPFGTTALPGGESIFAFLALPFALCLVLRGDRSLRDPWIIVTLAGSIAVFLVSGVRQVFLGSLIIVGAMVGLQIVRGAGRAAATLVAVVVIGAATFVGVQQYIVPQARESIAQAVGVPDIWQDRDVVDRFQTLLELDTYRSVRTGGFRMIMDRVTAFPFGAGLGRTGSAAGFLGEELERDELGAMIQERFGFQDNFFAAMLVETGIPGTLMLTVILLGLGLKAARLARRSPSQEDAAFGALVAGFMLAMLIMSWGSQPLLANPTSAFFWLLGGLAVRRLYDLEASVEQEDELEGLDPIAQE
jgi:hypothetical protein